MKNLRKLAPGLAVLMLGLALVTFAACQKADDSPSLPKPMLPGQYTKEAIGFNGKYNVTTTIGEYTIIDIQYTGLADTASVGGAAVPILRNWILDEQTAEVDNVSGATATSLGFKMAVREALEEAQAPANMLKAPSVPKKKEIMNVDVLVVGSGIAGYSAAIKAKTDKPQATVILIEKLPIIGGTTKFAAAVVYAAVNDADIPNLKNYYKERGQGNVDMDLVNYWADESLNTLTFLHDIGAAPGINVAYGMGSGTASAGRMRMGVPGAGLVQNLDTKAKSLGVVVLTGVKATKLIADKAGAVAGLKAESKSKGIEYTFNAKGGVVLATGGFDSDYTGLMATYNSDSKDDKPHSSSGNTGDGIKMAMDKDIGADTVFKGGKIGWVAIDDTVTGSHYYSAIIKNDGELLPETTGRDAAPAGTNKAGQQHPALDAVTYEGKYDDYAVVHRNMLDARAENPNVTFWAITNGPIFPASLETAGLAFTATTIEGLADKIKADKVKLQASFATHRALSAFGPPVPPLSDTEPGTFTAVRAKPSSIGSMGGLKINADAAVIRKSDGQPIPGLFAAGEIANGQFFYLEYPGSGSSLSIGATMGRTAGAKAAARLP